MVLESLLSPANAEKKRYLMLGFGFLASLVAGLVTYAIFLGTNLEIYASMAIVFFTALACVPLMYNIIKYEEEKDLQDLKENLLLKEHGKALAAFMFLFVGITIGMTLLFITLPWETVNNFFASQIDTLNIIRGGSSTTGMMTYFGVTPEQVELFGKIFFNNVMVLVVAILFSFVYGAGAIFVLTWNASVIATAIGVFIRNNLAAYSDLVGLPMVAKHFHIISVGLLKYSIHGIPEILAYFTAALAGGIISVAVIRHDFGTAKFEHIILDSADLVLISLGLLFVAAFLEVWITPIFFPF